METRSDQKKIGTEKLQRIIGMCLAVEDRKVDPFMLDVNDIIRVVREYFPQWEKPEELNLDSEAIHHLASVIKVQSEWVKSRSTSLYTDPFLLEAKISKATKEEMTQAFLKAWHPIVKMEQINLHSIAEALQYWDRLVPLRERWPELVVPGTEPGTTSRDELIKQRILGDRVFSDELEDLWQELKAKVKEKGFDGKIRYWNFIGSKTYEETARRAYMTSFLVTYGYATLEIRPLQEEIFVRPFEKPLQEIALEQSISIPIAVTFDEWQRWKRGELD